MPALGLFCVLGLGAVGLAAFALKYALDAVIEVKALKNSTHQIQFVPAEPPEDDERALNAALAKNDMEAFQRLSRLDDIQDHSDPLM